MADDVSTSRLTAIFDLDGTLVDTADDLAAAMNYALCRAGYQPVEVAQVRCLVGYGARRMLMHGFETAAGRAAEDHELDDGLSVFLDYYEQNIARHSAPFEGALAFIRGLRAEGWGVAICTNKRERLATLLIDALGLAQDFDVIVGADTAPAPKPDPAPVRLCLERTGAGAGVFFGDSDTDIRAAKAAGLPCLIAQFGYGPLTRAIDAAGGFSHYQEARGLIRKLTGR